MTASSITPASGAGHALGLAALESALADVPFYQNWRDRDPGPRSPIARRYAALPILTKRDMRVQMPKGFIPRERDFRAGIESGAIELVTTSGTSDDRATIVWHQPWWDASEHAAARLHAGLDRVIDGSQREAVLTTPLCAGNVCHIGDLSMAERTMGRLLFLNQKPDPTYWTSGDMERILDELNRFAPELLEADPAYLAILARHAANKGIAVQAPRFISLTFEFPSRLHYRQIRRLFPRTPILSSYGSTETGHVFTECERGHFHLNADYCRVDLQPLRARHGAPSIGRMLVTTLQNPWVSLLRFDVGDLGGLAAAPCPCGRGGLTLESIEGRTRDLTFTPDGDAVTLGAVDRSLGDIEGLLTYRIEQHDRERYRFLFVAEPGAEETVASAAGARLSALYGPSARLTTQKESAIVAEQSGKFRLARTLFAWDPETLFEQERNRP